MTPEEATTRLEETQARANAAKDASIAARLAHQEAQRTLDRIARENKARAGELFPPHIYTGWLPSPGDDEAFFVEVHSYRADKDAPIEWVGRYVYGDHDPEDISEFEDYDYVFVPLSLARRLTTEEGAHKVWVEGLPGRVADKAKAAHNALKGTRRALNSLISELREMQEYGRKEDQHQTELAYSLRVTVDHIQTGQDLLGPLAGVAEW